MVLFEQMISTLDRKRSIVACGGVAKQERPGHAIVEAIGPAGVSYIPVGIILLQADAVEHVGQHGEQRFERHRDPFCQPHSPRGKQQHERVIACEQPSRRCAPGGTRWPWDRRR